MTVRTQESLSGFIASEPHLSFTEKGDARLFVKIGQEQYRREEDGSVTKTEVIFGDLIAFRKTAERAHQRFSKGDRFVAEGYVHEYDRTDDSGRTVKAQEFVAKKIGHDLARTHYTVDRPRRTPEADSLDAGLEDAALSPDTERRSSAGASVVGR